MSDLIAGLEPEPVDSRDDELAAGRVEDGGATGAPATPRRGGRRGRSTQESDDHERAADERADTAIQAIPAVHRMLLPSQIQISSLRPVVRRRMRASDGAMVS